MVTRTFTKTIAEIMAVGKENKEVTNVTMFFSGKITNEDKLLKLAKAEYANSSAVPVAVKSVTYEEELRGMSEEAFLENSEILPPRNKKEDNE